MELTACTPGMRVQVIPREALTGFAGIFDFSGCADCLDVPQVGTVDHVAGNKVMVRFTTTIPPLPMKPEWVSEPTAIPYYVGEYLDMPHNNETATFLILSTNRTTQQLELVEIGARAMPIVPFTDKNITYTPAGAEHLPYIIDGQVIDQGVCFDCKITSSRITTPTGKVEDFIFRFAKFPEYEDLINAEPIPGMEQFTPGTLVKYTPNISKGMPTDALFQFGQMLQVMGVTGARLHVVAANGTGANGRILASDVSIVEEMLEEDDEE